MASVFDEMAVKKVFYAKGKFSNTRARFEEAPFQIVNIPGIDANWYFQPTPLVQASSDSALPLNQSGYKDGDEGVFRNGEGFQDMERIIMGGSHELGDYAGHPNDWRGMHKIGFF